MITAGLSGRPAYYYLSIYLSVWSSWINYDVISLIGQPPHPLAKGLARETRIVNYYGINAKLSFLMYN